MALVKTLEQKPVRLGPIEGYLGKKNEIIYHPPKCANPERCVFFFGGDVQDYEENMLKHRDNQHHIEWNLENTCNLLHNSFPNDAILVIKPSKMTLMTFSCFENFVEVNNFGAPTYQSATYPLEHLQALLSNVDELLKSVYQVYIKPNTLITLVGFSKGCVVLNQFLHSFLTINKDTAEDLGSFVNRITNMYWLEGGHSGSSATWVTNKAVLENFANMSKNVHIHVTPYQVLCDTRPRIGKEEKIFRDTLIKLGCNVNRVLHFEDEPRSLENHFKVLKVFH